MATKRKHKIVYVTSSDFKKEEIGVFQRQTAFNDNVLVQDLFDFEIRSVAIKETLEVSLDKLVRAEVKEAYLVIKVPCIVEHAGLIFSEYLDASYPGGLTKPMWNTLGPDFITETHSSGRTVLARSVVGYCDGMTVQTFTGETWGRIASSIRGSKHKFYWDTVFMPNDPTGHVKDMTNAEIVDDPNLGLEYKMLNLSQCTRALLLLLEHLRTAEPSRLWKE